MKLSFKTAPLRVTTRRKLLMTKEQFGDALEKLGFPQAEFSRVIDTDDREVRRWAAGQKPVPHRVALLLVLAIAKNLSGDDIRNIVMQ